MHNNVQVQNIASKQKSHSKKGLLSKNHYNKEQKVSNQRAQPATSSSILPILQPHSRYANQIQRLNNIITTSKSHPHATPTKHLNAESNDHKDEQSECWPKSQLQSQNNSSTSVYSLESGSMTLLPPLACVSNGVSYNFKSRRSSNFNQHGTNQQKQPNNRESIDSSGGEPKDYSRRASVDLASTALSTLSRRRSFMKSMENSPMQSLSVSVASIRAFAPSIFDENAPANLHSEKMSYNELVTVKKDASMAATVLNQQKLKPMAIVIARKLAKKAARNLRLRKMWSWAIGKVLRMIRATNAISTNRYFEEGVEVRVETLKKGAVDLGFQLENFKVANKRGGLVEALMKFPENRTTEEVRALELMIRLLPGFQRYSWTVRKKMGKVIGYSKFGPGRTILKQGHVAQNMYYLLSGELEELRLIEERHTWIGSLTPGAIFGELDLLDDETRKSTLVTTKDTELLWITRDDFDDLLKTETIKALDERKQILASNTFFSQLGSSAIQNLASASQIIEIEPNTHIIAELDIPNYVYLLCEGEFHMSKCIHFTKVKCPGRDGKYILYPFPIPRGIKTVDGYEQTTKLVRIAKISEGEHFGAASALASAGSPNQIRDNGSLL
ncbi:hypothetical protein BDR26DRAFT_8282 [Obelidium mucronatum]|nr:hypothetical protein BDR26DRAFT_8282 [Obelidium mucronatum]